LRRDHDPRLNGAIRALAAMPLRLILVVLAVALSWGGELAAQKRVRTETITPPAAPPSPPARSEPSQAAPPAAAPPPATPGTSSTARVVKPEAIRPAAPPAVLRNLAELPPPVARMRVRILEAARSGDLDRLLTVMQSNETMPVFSLGNEKSPTAYWKTSYPDSDGVEILAILIGILESGFVHIDQGTPQEMYVWPYFARTPMKELTAPQKVELFKIVTGSDFKEMQEGGAYMFYRLGIAPDGTWHFFIAGN
jgi:hypothetical protein